MVTITENWLTPSGDLGFNGRANAQKILIWSGDMPGHVSGDESGETPAGYYPTLDATIAALTDQWIMVFALNSAGENAGLDVLYRGHHQASEITAATGGMLFNSIGSGGSWIEDPIVEAITCISLDKDDDLDDENPSDCREPGQELTYTLYYANDDDETLQNAFIIDWLPRMCVIQRATGRSAMTRTRAAHRIVSARPGVRWSHPQLCVGAWID